MTNQGPLTQDEKDALPLTRKQALYLVEELTNYFTLSPHNPNVLRAMKERIVSNITAVPISHAPVIRADGGGSGFEALGEKHLAETIQRHREREAQEFAERRNFR